MSRVGKEARNAVRPAGITGIERNSQGAGGSKGIRRFGETITYGERCHGKIDLVLAGRSGNITDYHRVLDFLGADHSTRKGQLLRVQRFGGCQDRGTNSVLCCAGRQ